MQSSVDLNRTHRGASMISPPLPLPTNKGKRGRCGACPIGPWGRWLELKILILEYFFRISNRVHRLRRLLENSFFNKSHSLFTSYSFSSLRDSCSVKYRSMEARFSYTLPILQERITKIRLLFAHLPKERPTEGNFWYKKMCSVSFHIQRKKWSTSLV